MIGNLRPLVAGALFVCSLVFGYALSQAAAQSVPLQLSVDASGAPQKIYHVKLTMPAQAGPFTLAYPKWIPGFHGPVGPIADVVSLHVFANGAPVAWRRDLVDFYAIHTDLPAGVANLEVDFDLVGAPQTTGEMDSPSTANLAVLQWSSLLMYPQGASFNALQVNASLKLPPGWNFASALPVKSRDGGTIAFEPVTLYTLIDSPLLTGLYFKAVPLEGEHELDIAADSSAALDYSPQFLAGMKHLVAEGPTLYGDKHYQSYHFLLALSESISPNGIEHHQSSDNRAPEKYLTDTDQFRAFADLMPHEFSHSWNGKYRRPADLYVDDYQKPEKTDLLWVYEGLNQYVGELLTARSRLYSLRDQLDQLAINAAHMSVEGGRNWRPLRDTADEAPLLYEAPGQYYSLRRAAGDFYTEGDLIWLDADVTIRKLTNGSRSLDDFLKAWAAGGSRSPSVKTYTLDDVIATLNSIAANDWAGFFAQRIASVQPVAPLGGITGGGWKLVYDDTPSPISKADDTTQKTADFTFSLGLNISTDSDAGKDGEINDVLPGSIAERAGIAPGMKIIAVDGRRWSAELLHAALKTAHASKAPLELIVANGDFFKVASLAYYEGDRYPHLVREPGTADVLTRIYAPRTFAPPSS